MNQKTKIISIALLSVVTIFLIYFYFKSSVHYGDESTLKSGLQISKDKFMNDIDSIISSFGIRKDWIKDITEKEKTSKNKVKPLWISRNVLIPNDLPVIELNYEITNFLRANNFNNNVSEDPKTKNISMNIFSSPDSAVDQVGIINFLYSDSVKRNEAFISIVLDSLDFYSLSDAEKILSSSQEYSVILPLRNDKADYQSKIMDAKRDYLVNFFIGDENSIDADFKEDMKESLFKAKVKTASLNFASTSGIILTDNKNSPEFERNIKDEFEKNSLKVYSDTVFTVFRRGGDIVSSLIADIVSSSKEGRKILFYKLNLTPFEFNSFEQLAYGLKKSGYKFYNFKELIAYLNRKSNITENTKKDSVNSKK